MKLLFTLSLFFSLPAQGNPDGLVSVLKCSNLHNINDPQFEQGHEIFAQVKWVNSSTRLQVDLHGSAGGSTYLLDNLHIDKPSYSWISGRDSKTGALFRFAYLGGIHWGGYFDGPQMLGEELICSETKNFQKFLDAQKNSD